uniref:Uncharacterized protein n=1 Tax=Glossina austeni TaxID=7395 RepID=A0A1A9VSM9_GLOAU
MKQKVTTNTYRMNEYKKYLPEIEHLQPFEVEIAITTCLVSFNLLQNEFNSCIASNKSKLEHYGYGSSSFCPFAAFTDHFAGSLVIGAPGGTLEVGFPLPFGLFPAVDCFVSASVSAFGWVSILGSSSSLGTETARAGPGFCSSSVNGQNKERH